LALRHYKLDRGFACLFLAAYIHNPKMPTVISVSIGLVLGSMIGIAWFMPWAAIYTNLEMDVDEDEAAATDDS
jgi:hypothetical protein